MQMALVLLYNLDSAKLQKIRFLLIKLGLRAREVSPAEFGHPIGYLAGVDGFEAAQEAPEESFSQEMLVMAGLSSPQFGAFLEGLRQSRAAVALKAVDIVTIQKLTKINRKSSLTSATSSGEI